MNPTTWGPAEWEAFGTVGGLVVATVVAIFVAVQVLQAKQLREEQSRPYVIVDFEFRDFFIILSIRNIGGTAARNVVFTFDPEIRLPRHTHDEGDFDVLKSPIPMMAPGREIRVAFGSTLDFFAAEPPDVPFKYVVHVRYSDLAEKKPPYRDPPIHLDLLSYKNTLVSSDHVADIAKHLKNMDRIMKSWTAQNALKVRAFDQRKQDRRIHRRLQRRRDRRLLADEGLVAVLKLKWQAWKHRHEL